MKLQSLDIAAFRDLADCHAWTFAKTMPSNTHEYIVRWDGNSAAFVAAVKTIRDYGYERIYRGRAYTCLDVDGYYYWTMGEPAEKTMLINRPALKCDSS